jgi:hypothetical protein
LPTIVEMFGLSSPLPQATSPRPMKKNGSGPRATDAYPTAMMSAPDMTARL